MHGSWLYCSEHVYTACLQNAAFALGTIAPTPVVSRPWPKAQPHPSLCSSFRNTVELTGLVSTEKSALLQREKGIAVIPVCCFLPRPCLSEQKKPAIHSIFCGVRSLPTAARQSQHAGRGRPAPSADSDCVVLLVKGTSSSSLGACLCWVEGSSIWWLRVCQRESWGV